MPTRKTPRARANRKTAGSVPEVTVVSHRGDVTWLGLLEQALDLSAQAVVIADSRRRIRWVNATFERITGYAEHEILGTLPRFLTDRHYPRTFFFEMRRQIEETGCWEGQFWERRKNGELFRAWLSITALRDRSGHIENYVGLFSDRTERHAAEERIEFLANFDPLTELPNRSMLGRLLDLALADARRKQNRLAVLFIDLDHFKLVNDSLGHHAGDQLLVEVADRIRRTVRKSDIVARQGGDEFIVALSGLNDPGEAARIAEKLIDMLDHPIRIEQHKLRVGASIGVSIFPNDGDDKDALMKHADAAMYEAKRAGRGQYAYYSSVLNAQATAFALTASRLQEAIAKGEFDIHYQPQVETSTRRVIGFEALVRARNPEFGSPATFIPIAEKTGAIADLSEFVIVSVCRQIRHWLDEGFRPPKVAINVSAIQLRGRMLTRTLGEAAAFARIPRDALEVELTETSLMERLDEARETLIWLRENGIRVAIDDFGTGYSSLAYLQTLPIDRLKIDRSFVAEIGNGGEGMVARAIVGLANSLSLEVLAEGVETEIQAQVLEGMGCQYLQGYLFGRPIPSADVPATCAWTPAPRDRSDT